MKLSIIAAALGFACPAMAAAASLPAPVVQADWAAHKKFVQLPNGIRMAYVELGNPAGEPVLLLHGYTDSSRSWSLVAPHLTKYRLLIPDQRGHGATTAPECCYGPFQLAYDALLLLDALGISQAAVSGHSMGSMVAITLAAELEFQVSVGSRRFASRRI